MRKPGKRGPVPEGKESVWDYPRPPIVEDSDRHVTVTFNGVKIADTRRAKRVLETSHPPSYYIPPGDIRMEYLHPSDRTTVCEFKGRASYYTIEIGKKRAKNAAWYYPAPNRQYEAITGYVCFYPGRMDRCTVDGETVSAQEGSFYGGWITSELVGPFKGAPGTFSW